MQDKVSKVVKKSEIREMIKSLFSGKTKLSQLTDDAKAKVALIMISYYKHDAKKQESSDSPKSDTSLPSLAESTLNTGRKREGAEGIDDPNKRAKK